MIKRNSIDERDKKILAELDNNARQTDSEIAKKISTSKQVVNYRIQKLISKEIIHNFYTIVDISKLGLDFYYVFLQLENINKEQEENLLKRINKLGYVGWLVGGTGRWDVVVGVNADSIINFERYLSQIINLCGNHLHEYIFTALVGAEHLSYKFLKSKGDSYGIKQESIRNVIKLDSSDKKILKTISQDARLPITEISEKTKLPLHVVNYHLKNLVKNKTIEGFKPKLNINQLGYQWHLLLVQFKKINKSREKQFIEFCKQHKKIYYITRTIGNYNLMLDLHVSNAEEFKEVLLDIKDEFSDLIKTYESMTIFEEYKIDYIPSQIL